MVEKALALIITAGLSVSFNMANIEMSISEWGLYDAMTNAYLMPDPDPKSEHYAAQQAAAINFRFKVFLTSNCVIESFILEPEPYIKARGLEACVLIPVGEFDAVFTDPEYAPDLRNPEDEIVGEWQLNRWGMEEQDVAYFYMWPDDTGSSTREHIIVVAKPKVGMVKVGFKSYFHTVLNSIEDLRTWYPPD